MVFQNWLREMGENGGKTRGVVPRSLKKSGF